MSKRYFENEVFEKEEGPLPGEEYEQCTFRNCNFYQAKLSDLTFTECIFEHCNLGMADVKNTAFKDVRFVNCKLTGLDLSDCNKFLLSLDFDHCDLSFAIFYRLQLKNTRFSNCQLREADFTETNLTGSLFLESDLTGAVFDQTNLEKADLRSAHYYSIDPERNRLKQAKFDMTGLPGLLHKYGIEIC